MDRSMFAERSPTKGVYFQQRRYYQHSQKNKHVHQQRPWSRVRLYCCCRGDHHQQQCCLIWIPPPLWWPFCTAAAGWNPKGGSLLPSTPRSAWFCVWNSRTITVKAGGGEERERQMYIIESTTKDTRNANRSTNVRERLFLFDYFFGFVLFFSPLIRQ